MQTIVLLSGGMDSTTLLAYLKSLGHEVKAIGFDYGQRHVRELRAAQEIAMHYEVPFRVADMRGIGAAFMQGSSQTTPDVPVPEGHYEEESMKQTVVPNRNMIMLSIATAYAIQEKYNTVAYAAHRGDHAIYPDCRPAFVHALQETIRECDWHSVKLVAPFLDRSKADIVRLGYQLFVPYEKTWTCYKGGDVACGKCGTCVERREAFHNAFATDPIPYEV